jgi:threonylcarbamoyladenosine tRNA methylthiotransferase MtaB
MMAGPRVHITTLGCKVNQCDADEIAHALAARGYRIVGRDDQANVYIVNTCTVTATADAKARKLIRKLHRQRPEAQIIVTGCLAQRDPEACAKLPAVSAVVPNSQKHRLADVLPVLPSPVSPSSPPPSRTRAFLKIQDGCDHHCAYCAVPDARGRPVSKPMGQVLGEIEELAAAGAPELVLCGIRLGAYGADTDDAGGLAALLHELRGAPIPRLRLSSLEPMDAGDDFLAEIADHPRLCHHLHLPLQSGDDGILAAMNRGYTREDFARLVDRVRSAWPDAAITTDIMVAFPGETDEQFQHTVGFAREIAFSRVHVFPYSPRPGTPAAARRDRISAPTATKRTQQMLVVARDLARGAARSWVGKTVSVLFEEREKSGPLTGLTEHYVRLSCTAPEELIGRIAEVIPHDELDGALLAQL